VCVLNRHMWKMWMRWHLYQYPHCVCVCVCVCV